MVNYREIPMFVLGCVLLSVLLYSSHEDSTLQYNIIWMVMTSLSVAIVVRFLPSSGEVLIPGWAKFGGSAAVLLGCMYLIFGLSEKTLQKDNKHLTETYETLARENSANVAALKTLQEKISGKETAQTVTTSSIAQISASLDLMKGYISQAQQHAIGATTNTSDLRGCINAAQLAANAAGAALGQYNSASALLRSLPR